jgi:DNA-binding NarL/FixJ family response regulator
MAQIIAEDPRLGVCAHAGNAAEALDLCANHRPDVAVVDIGADGGGTVLLRDLSRVCPTVRLVAWTNVIDLLSIQRVLAAGALGYLLRSDPESDVLMAIHHAAAGRRHVGSRVRGVLLNGMAGGGVQINDRPESALSDRELQVFRLLGQGKKMSDIAEELGVSVKTVETHVQHMKEKLGLSSLAELRFRAVLAVSGGKVVKLSGKG